MFSAQNTEKAAGLVHLDARWYNPYTSRFVQPDLWNFASTGLPSEVQHEVMQFAGLNTNLLLGSPAQQLKFGYVSNNPLAFIDPLGFAKYLCELGNFTIPITQETSSITGEAFKGSVSDMTYDVMDRIDSAGINDNVDLSDYNASIGTTDKYSAYTQFTSELDGLGLNPYNPGVVSGTVGGVLQEVGVSMVTSPVKDPVIKVTADSALSDANLSRDYERCDNVRAR